MKTVRITVRDSDLDRLEKLLDVIDDAPYISHKDVIDTLKSVLRPIGRITTTIRHNQ